MGAVRTDLAMENLGTDSSLPGVDVHRWEESDIQLSEVVIRTEEAARQLGKPCGNYLTLECRLLCEHDPDARLAMANLLGEELSRMLAPSDDAPVLVVGLGNRGVTPRLPSPTTSTGASWEGVSMRESSSPSRFAMAMRASGSCSRSRAHSRVR